MVWHGNAKIIKSLKMLTWTGDVRSDVSINGTTHATGDQHAIGASDCGVCSRSHSWHRQIHSIDIQRSIDSSKSTLICWDGESLTILQSACVSGAITSESCKLASIHDDIGCTAGAYKYTPLFHCTLTVYSVSTVLCATFLYRIYAALFFTVLYCNVL